MTPPRIITNYWAKPIPDRRFDWSAMEDGGNEMMCGWGRTEAEAVKDLRRLHGPTFCTAQVVRGGPTADMDCVYHPRPAQPPVQTSLRGTTKQS
jgi:hypothetical protein